MLISEVEEKEIFKICLEYWNHLSAELYHENPFSSTHSTLILSQQPVPPRRQLYLPVLSKVPIITYFMYGSFCVDTVYACAIETVKSLTKYFKVPKKLHSFLTSINHCDQLCVICV